MQTKSSFYKTIEVISPITRKLTGLDIYVNPDANDIRKIKQEASPGLVLVKFLADSTNKKVYVWDATKAFHEKVQDTLDFKGRLLAGISFIKGSKLQFTELSGPRVSGDWKWLDSYILGASSKLIQWSTSKYKNLLTSLIRKNYIGLVKAILHVERKD